MIELCRERGARGGILPQPRDVRAFRQVRRRLISRNPRFHAPGCCHAHIAAALHDIMLPARRDKNRAEQQEHESWAAGIEHQRLLRLALE